MPLIARSVCRISSQAYSQVRQHFLYIIINKNKCDVSKITGSITYHTVGVLPSTQPVAMFGSSCIVSSFDLTIPYSQCSLLVSTKSVLPTQDLSRRIFAFCLILHLYHTAITNCWLYFPYSTMEKLKFILQSFLLPKTLKCAGGPIV